MGTKNIAISDEAYQRLKALKKPGESFTEVIDRMTRSRGVLDLAGLLSKEEASRVSEVIRETRRESSKRLRRTAEILEWDHLLADTTFLIDVMKADAKAVSKAKELEAASTPVMVGAPTIFELYVGVGLSVRSAEERGKVLEVLGALTQLPLDRQSATRAGLIYAQRSREGVEMDPEDAMLAGIAVENHEALLTRNRKHFAGIPDLKLESY